MDEDSGVPGSTVGPLSFCFFFLGRGPRFLIKLRYYYTLLVFAMVLPFLKVKSSTAIYKTCFIAIWLIPASWDFEKPQTLNQKEHCPQSSDPPNPTTPCAQQETFNLNSGKPKLSGLQLYIYTCLYIHIYRPRYMNIYIYIHMYTYIAIIYIYV